MHYEHIKNRKPDEFVRLTGVRRGTFEAMLQALHGQIRAFGRPPKLPLCDQLLLTLMYWREYRTLFHIASAYGLSEAPASRTVRRVENALMRSGRFTLPGKKALRPSEMVWQVVVIDATECVIDATEWQKRPKKRQNFFSGKKKRHTLKAQVVVEQQSGRIVVTAFCAGHTHDFALFKSSRLWLCEKSRCLADAGYRGLNRWHQNSQTPHQKSKHHPLTPEQKEDNRQWSSQRMVVEHALARLKVFGILSGRYRNRRKRFGLRFNLLAAISNHQLQSTPSILMQEVFWKKQSLPPARYPNRRR